MDANSLIVIITLCLLIIPLSLSACVAILFPSFFPTLFRYCRQALANFEWPWSANKFHGLKSRSSVELQRLRERGISSQNPTPTHTPAPSISLPNEIRRMSILPVTVQDLVDEQIGEGRSRRESRVESMSIEVIPPDLRDMRPVSSIIGSSLVAEETSSSNQPSRDSDHPENTTPTQSENSLSSSPTPSTRPPTYYTDASRTSIYTLPLYRESEDDRPVPVQSTARDRRYRNGPLERPPLPVPPSSYPLGKVPR